MIEVPCSDLKHSFGQLDSGEWIEEYYIDLPNGSAVLFSQPIQPNRPSQTPVTQVGEEKGLCVPVEGVSEEEVVAEPQPVASPAEAGEVGLGSFFLLMLVCIGGVKLFTYLREREAKQMAGYLPEIRGAEVWQQLPAEREKLPREQWVDSAIGQRAIALLEEHEQAEVQAQAQAAKTSEFRSETSPETTLKQLETRLETGLKRLETLLNQTERFQGAAAVSAEMEAQGEFDLADGATSEVMARFVALVKAGFNPRGQPIIEKLWGIKAGGSSAYKTARELRDQLANRLNEFEGFNHED